MELTVEMWREAVRRGDTESGFDSWRVECEIKRQEAEREANARYTTHRFSQYEMASIVAGLRLLQAMKSAGVPSRLHLGEVEGAMRLASSWETSFDPLEVDEIDDLVQRMNLDQTIAKPEVVDKPVLGYLYRRRASGKTVTIGVHPPKGTCVHEIVELVAKG